MAHSEFSSPLSDLGAETEEVPYTSSDLGCTKPNLIRMIQRQQSKWPDANFHGGSRVKVRRMRAVLGNPAYGFTKCQMRSVLTQGPNGATENLTAQQVDTAHEDGSPEDSEQQHDEELMPLHGGAPVVAAGVLRTASLQPGGSSTPPVAASDPGVQGTGSQFVSDTEDLRLLIEDRRTSSTAPIKSVVNLTLTATARPSALSSPHWFADAHELLTQLQDTFNALHGCVRLSFPDPIDPVYRVFFAANQRNEKLQDVAPKPRSIAVSKSTNTLVLYVDNNQLEDVTTSKHAREDMSDEPAQLNNDNTPVPKTPEHVKRRKTSESNQTLLDDQAAEDAEVEWLRSKAATCAGYSSFTSHQRRLQQNSGVVESWKFVESFTGRFFKEVSGLRGSKTIKKKTIAKALKIGTTGLAEAENAVRIINMYGPGGSREAPEVVSVLAEKDSKSPGGVRVLLPFLLQWESEH